MEVEVFQIKMLSDFSTPTPNEENWQKFIASSIELTEVVEGAEYWLFTKESFDKKIKYKIRRSFCLKFQEDDFIEMSELQLKSDLWYTKAYRFNWYLVEIVRFGYRDRFRR